MDNYIKEHIIQYVNDYPKCITMENYREIITKHIQDISNDFITIEEIEIYMNDKLDQLLFDIKLERTSSYDFELQKNIQEHIKILMNIEQPQQKTDEWYKFRYNHITASNAWKGYSESISCKNQLIYEKSKPFDINKNKGNLNESAFTWGHKYEPLSCKLYEYKNNTIISEFGCIEHKNYSFLAASPDGIVTGENNFGIMIEIKNVVSRIINGNPKKDYYIQMQLQMEVCDLDHCHFIETKFIEYENFDEYMIDGNINYTNENKEKGIIKIYIKNNEEYHYEYMPFDITSTENMTKWLDEENIDESLVWFKNVYWKLDIYSCIHVPRCKLWFNSTIEELENLWKKILEVRQTNTYQEYSPKKRKKDDKEYKQQPSKCLLILN